MTAPDEDEPVRLLDSPTVRKAIEQQFGEDDPDA